MPNVNVKGRYRIYTHDGVEPLLFTSYSNSLCSIRRPNPNTFITISTYIPGSLSPFTTFDPGSSYTIVTKSNTADFSMGPYTRADRLPSSVTFRSPNFYHGLDKNSITVALSSYALSVNAPLSTAFTYIPNQDGYFVNSISFDTERFKEGLPSFLTHLTPNSSYQFKTRTPFTFFAPLQSEMGDAFAIGDNTGGQYGMGYRVDNMSLPGDNIYGVWDKIVFNNFKFNCSDNNQTISAPSLAALSSCGTTKALFVLGNNVNGQLGTGSDKQYYATWTKVPGQWKDVELCSSHMLAINSAGHLYACGKNDYGQLGLGSGTLSANTLTLVDNARSYVELAAYTSCTMVRDSNGFIYACGRNNIGQLCINNISSPIYTLTQEASGLSWSSVKASIRGYFVAISNKKLFGSPITDRIYWGGANNPNYAKYTFAQERLSLSDVLETYISSNGTIIRRENQNNLFAVGYNTTIKRLALLSGTTTSDFTQSSVPSNANIIAPGDGTFSSINYYYILNGKLYYKATNSNSFIQTDINAFNIFSGIQDTPTFILSARNDLRPTPTPTPTITPTPSPVPIQPLNVSQIGIFASSQKDSNNAINTNSYVNGIPDALNNALTQTFFLKGTSSGILNHAYDYEKGNEYNRVVGIGFDGQDYNNNYPRYLYYHGGPYTKMSTEFNKGRNSDYYGYDALMITPPDPLYSATQQGIYLYAYFKYVSSPAGPTGEYRLSISYDRGVTWPIYGTLYGMTNSAGIAYYDVANGATCRPIFSMSRQRTATSRFDVRVLFNANFVYSVGSLHSSWPRGLVSQIAYPSGTGPLETVYNQMGEYGPTYRPFGYAFNHDYFNIPTAVSIGYDSVIRNNKILIHRRINNTWITDTVLTDISDACNRANGSFSSFAGYNKNLISIEFNPANPDIIYIAYILNSGASTPTGVTSTPRRINVITYNMQTKTLIQNQKVISSIAGDPGYARITAVGNFTVPVDIPTLFYDKIAQKLYLYCYVAMIDANFRSYDTVFTTSTSDNTNWSALVQFTPTCQSGSVGVCLGRFISDWDLKVKY